MFSNFSNNQLVLGSCTRCHGFDFNRVKYQIKPDFYPPKLCDPGQNYVELNTKKLSFKTMHATVKLSFDDVKSGHWTNKNDEYYLQMEGIDGMLTGKRVDFATNSNKFD